MKSRFEHIALVGKYQSPTSGVMTEPARKTLEGIALFLRSQGCTVSLEAQTAAHMELPGYPALDVDEIGQQCDLGLVVGGDGTMLSIGRQVARYGTPLIGINQGRLGFITDIPLDNYQATLAPMLHGQFEEDHRPLMQARVLRDGVCVFDTFAMNDVVVNRGATSGMVELRIEVDGHFVANQRADGLIVASPTGSTAYSLSAGGPMLHPSLPGWVLVPIAPHILSNRPIVLADITEIAIEIVNGRDVSANFDMQSRPDLRLGDRILVRRAEYCVRFLHPRGWSYFDTLRKKLRWNEGGS
ncbi:NAD kinase [Giesbergeria anulus]|uniref:NAD kinase n=1 Tax=Giesbergeria anulus TaxID=180197 RepID=A0A1H9K0H7_9BURK|nr:NAD kinase [Giesbergeria anulus]SEQ92622.1 NAD+ kinase [Giesbergeria anulus]